MKKVLIGTLTVVLVLTAITAGAFAAGRGQGSRFVDADGNGICDNYASGCQGTGCGSGWGHGSGRGGHHGGWHS